MAARATRRSVAAAASKAQSTSLDQSLPSSDVKSPVHTQKKSNRKKSSAPKRGTKSLDSKSQQTEESKESGGAESGTKRKRDEETESEEYEELPHNLGRIPKAKNTIVKEEDNAADKALIETGDTKDNSTSTGKKRKGTAAAPKQSEANKSPKKKVKAEPESKAEDEAPVTPAKGTSKGKKTKAPKTNEYGLTPGVSPFPDYERPTAEECFKVADILRAQHPDCKSRPKTIPAPSQIVTGCGEVPSILDALIRTLLSAATTSNNSNSAYQGMVARYGNRKTGVGKGSVDYNAVRTSSQADLEAAIASGGLAKAKSKNIKALLDMVYEENQQRRKEHLLAKSTGNEEAGPKGAQHETEEQKNAEIAIAEEEVLSLDHYYTLPTYDAIFTFVKYPGIGVKTAACVSLFCMQRDCFAVDTHVFRLCKWLGWLPDDNKRVSRDTAFSHLEVRIPDELKYDLHQLFIRHGKTCPRCRASTGETSAKWEDGCVIDHLVKRTGPRKEGGGSSPVKKAAKSAPGSGGKVKKGSKKKGKDSDDGDEDEDEDEDVDMPDLGDDEKEDDAAKDAVAPSDEDEDEDAEKEEEYKAPAKTTKRTRNMPVKEASVPKKSRKASSAVKTASAAPAKAKGKGKAEPKTKAAKVVKASSTATTKKQPSRKKSG